MKIAVISDVHSNAHALEAVLADLEMVRPDVIVGAGDMVGCSAYAGAADVWERLTCRNIAFVLGNEEERILKCCAPEPDPYLTRSVRFRPLQYRLSQFTAAQIDQMRALPLSISLAGPQGQDVLVCHGSPRNLNKSPMLGIDAEMERELEGVPASVIAIGHLHSQWHCMWRGKLLVMAGSAGLPLRGRLGEIDYLILMYAAGVWRFTYRSVRYNDQAAVQSALNSDFLLQAGPIGWLMFDEMLTQEDRLTPFFRDACPADEPVDETGWERLMIGFLTRLGRWEPLRRYLQPFI